MSGWDDSRNYWLVSLAAALELQDDVLAEMLKLASWDGANSGFPGDPKSNATNM